MTGLAVVVVVYGALIGVTAFRWERRAPRVRRDLNNNERRRSW
jgi:hypothetical protein